MLYVSVADIVILIGSLLEAGDPLQIVGGTFIAKGALTFSQYIAVCRVLRVSIYLYFSLLLERDLFSNARVELHYPKPPMPHLPSYPTSPNQLPSAGKDKSKRDSAGLWSFLSKKTEEMIHRATNINTGIVRRGSLDGHNQRFPRHTSLPHGPDGSGFLARRLSILSGVSSLASRDSSDAEPGHKITYAAAIRRMETWSDLLSTSPGVAFPLPAFLRAIAEQESKDPARRPVGDERAALSSLLGWHGRESLGRGMVGMDGFVRHQGFSALYSEHVPGAGASSLLTSPPPTPSKSDAEEPPVSFPPRIACGGHRRRWLHFRYFERGARSGRWDESIGETVMRWCATAREPCGHPECHFLRAEHDMRWIHAGTRLIGTVSLPQSTEDPAVADEQVRMWHSCAICGKEGPKTALSDGAL